MTWPKHDAGSTTPESARDDGDLERDEADEPTRRYPDPLPPLEGPMLGGGPTPAETTLPLALNWPAPPPRTTQRGPEGWRRVGRPGDPRPDQAPRQPTFTPHPPGTAPRQPTFTPHETPPVSQPTFTPHEPPAPYDPEDFAGTQMLPRLPVEQWAPEAPAAPGPRRPAPAGPAPAERTGPQRTGLIRSSLGMAVGTMASRVTGFLRTFVFVAALGTSGVGNAYNVSNTLPNTVYYLMLGGIFTSVVVPLLVKAAKQDPDRGEAYAQRIFTLGVVALFGVTVVATLAAAPLVDIYATTIHGTEHHLMVIWAYFFIPQIFFYGMSSLIGAVLNTRGRFAAPMWTPVINNLIVIVVGGLYVVTVGLNKTPATIPAGAVQLLGVGTTLGVVVQTIALFPSLRGAGFRWRFTLGFRPGEIGEMGRMAGWMLCYVATQQVGFLVVSNVANAASNRAQGAGFSVYSYAWQLFQLPYAIIGYSVITALLPRMSEHAAGRRYSLVRDDFSTGIRLSSVIVVPAAIFLAVLGAPIGEFIFSYGSNGINGGTNIGVVFGLFSLGLVPYMITQLQLRVFYAFQDSRTAALVGVLIMAVGITGDLIALKTLPAADVVAGLAVAYGAANLIGAVTGWALLLRRVGSLDGWNVARSLTRMHLATVPGLIFAAVVMLGVGHVLHNPGRGYGFVVTVIGGAGAMALYAVSARFLRVAELGFLTRTMSAKFSRRGRRH
jgi:putative peptidoglycan lipid II flippase